MSTLLQASAGFDFENFMYNMNQDLQARFGILGMFIPLLVVVVGLTLFFLIVVKTYGGYQRKKYGFRMFLNWPGLVVMGCYSVAFLLGIVEFANTAMGLLIMLFLAGAPGMIMYFIKCFRETRNIVITVVNTALMAVLYMLLGYVLGFFIMLLCVLLGVGLVVSLLMSGNSYKCPSCGASCDSKTSACPRCGE